MKNLVHHIWRRAYLDKEEDHVKLIEDYFNEIYLSQIKSELVDILEEQLDRMYNDDFKGGIKKAIRIVKQFNAK